MAPPTGSAASPPDVPPPPTRFTPIPFAPQKNSGQFRNQTHSTKTGAVDQEHTEGVVTQAALDRVHEEIAAERPANIAAVTRPPERVFGDIEAKQDARYGARPLPWKNPKFFSKAELDGKFPKVLRDRGFENMKTDVPEVLMETGRAHNDKRIGKCLRSSFMIRLTDSSAEELGLPEFGKFQPPPPVDMKISFDCVDLDKAGNITKANLRQVLAQCGHAPSETELENMITMASLQNNSDGEPCVTWEAFDLLFRSPKDLFQRVDMSKITEVDVWEVGGGIDLYREAGQSADVKPVDAGVEIGVPAKNKALVLEFFCVGAQTILKPSDLKRLYRDFQRVAGDREELNYDEFLQFIERPQATSAKSCLIFDADQGGTVSLKEFIIALTNFTNAKPEEKFKFSFMLYDEDHSETIDVNELRSLIAANYMCAGYISEEELEEKVENVYASINADFGMNLDLALFLRCCTKNPLLFAPHPVATPEMEERMRKEQRMRGDRDVPRTTRKQKKEQEAAAGAIKDQKKNES